MQLHYRGIPYAASLTNAAATASAAAHRLEQSVTLHYRGIAHVVPLHAMPAESLEFNSALAMQYRGVPMNPAWSKLAASAGAILTAPSGRLRYRGVSYSVAG
jgi:hypothetical protein